MSKATPAFGGPPNTVAALLQQEIDALKAGLLLTYVTGSALAPGAFISGMAVTIGESGGSLISARCNAASAGTSFCTGIVTKGTPAFPLPNEATVQAAGIVTLTTAEWDAVIQEGSSTGLTVGVPYFLSDSANGKITATPNATSGHFVTLVGWALSPTELLFQPTTPLQNA